MKNLTKHRDMKLVTTKDTRILFGFKTKFFRCFRNIYELNTNANKPVYLGL